MLYKEDWRKAQERWKAWWDSEIIDHVAISVEAPSRMLKKEKALKWDTWDFCRHISEPEKAFLNFENCYSSTYFGGEAFPNLWINLGGPVLAAYMGSATEFKSDTIWFKSLGDWNKILGSSFDPSNEYWKLTKRITEKATLRGKEKFIVGMTDLGSAGEALGMLRGVKNFAMDLFLRQKEVRIMLEKLQKTFFYCYDELYNIIKKGGNGISSWVGTWSPKRMFTLDHDLIVYMSPEKFRVFELPYIREECERFDHTIFHLDGKLSIPHLDSLLNITELGGIQWVPGEGQNGCESSTWMPMYKKIQKSRKLLVLNVPKESVRFLIKELSPRGLLLRTVCNSEKEARSLLKSVLNN